MPTKVWVIGEEALADDFNTYVQEQVVTTFPNTAGRDTWANPPDGALCVTVDTYTVWVRKAGAWQARSAPKIQHSITDVTIDSGGNGQIVYPSVFAAQPSVIATWFQPPSPPSAGARNWLIIFDSSVDHFSFKIFDANNNQLPNGTHVFVMWQAMGAYP